MSKLHEALRALADAIERDGDPAFAHLLIEARAAPAEPVADEPVCRTDGRCQYAIDHAAEGLIGHCPKGKCCMPAAAPAERGEYPPLPPPDYAAGEKGMLGEDCYAASTVRRLLDADRAQRSKP